MRGRKQPCPGFETQPCFWTIPVVRTAQSIMTEAEFTIVNFLQSSPETFFARKEITRRAVKRQVYEGNPHWADAALAGLLLKSVIEQNAGELYRLKKGEELP